MACVVAKRLKLVAGVRVVKGSVAVAGCRCPGSEVRGPVSEVRCPVSGVRGPVSGLSVRELSVRLLFLQLRLA